MRRAHVGPVSRGALAALVATTVLVAAACGGSSPEPTAPAEPSKDYRAAAKSAIDEKNMNAELDKLRAEIDADSK